MPIGRGNYLQGLSMAFNIAEQAKNIEHAQELLVSFAEDTPFINLDSVDLVAK